MNLNEYFLLSGSIAFTLISVFILSSIIFGSIIFAKILKVIRKIRLIVLMGLKTELKIRQFLNGLIDRLLHLF